MKWPTRCKECEDANDPVKLRDEIVTLKQQRDELQAMSVTNILLDVVPGEDGMGEEVYAKSVADVERAFTKLCDKLEAVEQQRDELLLAGKSANEALESYNSNSGKVNLARVFEAQHLLRAAIAKATQL